MKKYLSFTCCSLALITFSLLGDHSAPSEEIALEATVELPEDFDLKNCSTESTLAEEARMTAYIQGLLDAKYSKYNVIVSVRNGQILLANLPKDSIRTAKIINYVKKISSISNVIADASLDEKTTIPEAPVPMFTIKDCTGIWIPQSTTLFPTQVANPRHISFSVGPRFHDTVGGNWATAFSFGDQFPIYRWANMWRWKGDLQLEVEAGLFAVFNHDDKNFPMQNADYYVGIPLTYAKAPWTFRGRFYHISSHLGDEYMEDHKDYHRKNKSFEAADFSACYQMNEAVRLYGTLGAVVHSDPEMRLKPFYVEYGLEVRGNKHYFSQLFCQPFAAMHVQNAQQHEFRFDPTIAVGYEWSKIQGLGRKIRAYGEFHTGFSPDGQFSNRSTTYYGIKLEYGF